MHFQTPTKTHFFNLTFFVMGPTPVMRTFLNEFNAVLYNYQDNSSV